MLEYVGGVNLSASQEALGAGAAVLTSAAPGERPSGPTQQPSEEGCALGPAVRCNTSSRASEDAAEQEQRCHRDAKTHGQHQWFPESSGSMSPGAAWRVSRVSPRKSAGDSDVVGFGSHKAAMARVIRPLQVDSQPRYATPVRYATPSRSAACRHATPGRLSPQPVPCGWAGWAPPPHPGWVAIPMAYSQVQPPAQSPAELAVGVTVRIGSVQCVISEPLGMGSFGVVWAARCDGKSKEVAVKEMICSNETELHRAEYEISLLKTSWVSVVILVSNH
eukprot:s1670_g12.t1